MSDTALVVHGRKSITVSWGERALLARALAGEVGVHGPGDAPGWWSPRARTEGLAVLWCMAQRLVVVGRWATLSELVVRYCQPVNPRWARGGDLELRERRRLGHRHGALRQHERRLRRRERLRGMQWADFDPGLRALVADFLAGATESPVPTAVHFAAPTLRCSRPRVPVRGRGAHGQGNVFYATRVSQREDRAVRVEVVG